MKSYWLHRLVHGHLPYYRKDGKCIRCLAKWGVL